MKLLVAIPAFNEELSISHVIQMVKKDLPTAKLLVIDDGSTDNTEKQARQAGADVISLPFNCGVGSAMRTAFNFAIKNDFTHVIQIDADGQHLPSEAIKLIKASEKNSIVVGSRFSSNESIYKTGIFRRLAMRLLAKLVNFNCKLNLTDVTSGFRLTSGSIIGLFAKEYPREYLGDTVESLIIANRHGASIREVPVEMQSRLNGVPSQNLIKSAWHLFRALLIIVLTILRKK